MSLPYFSTFSPKVSALTQKKQHHADIIEIFKQVRINIPLLNVIQQIPTYAKFLKDLCTVKRKLNVQKKAFLTEQVSTIIQSNTPPKYKILGSPTIACVIGSSKIGQALLDHGSSVNLLPYTIYEQLGLGELKPTPIILQLVDQSIKMPRGIVEDVLVQIDKFFYSVDFVVLDVHLTSPLSFQAPVILGRPSLATSNALINCISGVLKLSFGNMTLELNIFNTCRQPHDLEEVHEVNLLEAILDEEAYLAHQFADLQFELEDECELSDLGSNHCDVSFIEDDYDPHWRPKFELLLPLTVALHPSANVVSKLYLKSLPTDLKYTFLGPDNTYRIVVFSLLIENQEQRLIAMLRQHKGAIGWTMANIKGISPLICTHRIYLEENAKTSREMQRRLNPTMKEVVKNEVLKLLDVSIINLISDSKWVSPTQVVTKKSGLTIMKNDQDELIPMRMTTSWCMFIDYRKLNTTTRKDHFPLPFLDQILESVVGHAFYCFLNFFSRYYHIEIALEDQEKTTFTCRFSTFVFRRMPFGLCNAPATFQRCMLNIFSDMVENILEIFMDDFSIFWQHL